MGYTEIQLLGQNVNSYRDPSPAGWDFARLLRAVGEVDGIRRVRFTTSHPRDFVKDIVDAIDENPVLCNHVHLPVQSGSNDVLARMQRLYTRDDYLRRIEWMKAARRDISITTDIIVGFPGETEAEFNETISLLDRVQYDSLFASSIPDARTRPLSRSTITSRKKKRAAASLSCRNTSAPSRSAAIRNWWEAPSRPSWRVIIRPRDNGSAELHRIAFSTSFTRGRPGRPPEKPWSENTVMFELRARARIR